MNKDEFKNKVFDEMLAYASEQSVLNISKELPKEENLKESITPSVEFETKMKKMIGRHKRKERYKKIISTSKKVAAVLILFMLLGTMTIMSVDAFRVKFFNIITELNEEYIQFKFEDNTNIDPNPDKTKIPESTLENNTALYVPTYIPEGYELLNIQEANDLYRVTYTNEEERIIFIQSNPNTTDTAMDTEGAYVIKITISDNEGYFIERDEINSIMWQSNEKVFTIHGSLKQEELIKIADSVKLQKNKKYKKSQ